MRARARMRMPAAAALAALLAAWPGFAHADAEGAGTRAASFLQAGGAPRWTAMGGAGLASGSDLASGMWNAAALAAIPGSRWEIAHAPLADGAQQAWAAAGGRHASGVRWALSALHRAEGDIEGRDEANRPTRSYAAQSLALGISLARPVASWLSLGGTARYVGEHIGEAHGNGVAFGIGAQARAGMLRLALTGQDFGGGMLWQGQRWAMPATLAGGAALVHERSGLTLAADIASPAAAPPALRTGLEWMLGGRGALRAGWRQALAEESPDRASAASFGVALAAGALWLDYSFEDGVRESGMHRIGVSLASKRTGGAIGPAPAVRAATPAPEPARD